MSKESSDVQAASKIIIEAFKRGNKLLIFGNGGSAAQAQHMASELVWRFKKERKALPAIALGSDCAILTAIANDLGYESVFERELDALGRAGDVAMGLSTSGASWNVIRALAKSSARGLQTIRLNNRQSYPFLGADVDFDFISTDTAKAQEAHLKIIHLMCDLIEREFD